MNVLAAFGILMVAGSFAAGQVSPGGAIRQPASEYEGTPRRPMTFADLMRMRRVSDPQISPSGKWVMFSVTEVNLETNSKISNLWVVPMKSADALPPGSSTSLLKGKQIEDMGHLKKGSAGPDRKGDIAERQLTFGNVSQTNGRFSPDGKWILLVSPGGGTSQIWTAKWDDSNGTIQKPYPLTSVATEADGAVWSPNSKQILFVSSVYPECSDKAAWAEEDACNKARLEAEAKDPVKAQVWDHLLYRHWNAFTGERRSHVLVVDFANGEQVRDLTPKSAVGDAETPTFSLGGPLGYAWAPDGREIAYVTNLDRVPAASTNNDVFTLRLDEAGAKAVKVSTSLGSDDGPQYSADGRYLAFRSQERAGYESDRFRLMLYDRQEQKTRELLPKFDRWVDEFAWGPDSNMIYLVGGDEGAEPVYSMNLSQRYLAQITDAGEYGSPAVAPDGRSVVVTGMAVDQPAELSRVELRSEVVPLPSFHKRAAPGQPVEPPASGSGIAFQNVFPLTAINRGVLGGLELAAMDSFWFTGAEDMRVQGFIVRPPNFDPLKKYPVKFLIHGGPQGAWGDAWSYRWNPEMFAADGYVVVMVNPRGSTGYGQAFVDGVNGDWGGKAYVDLMRGLDAAEAKYPFIDKARECALGGSYGGYMTNWILTHTNRFACIVTHDGMYNPAAAYGDTEEIWFNEWEFRRPDASEPGQPWRYSAGPAADDPFRKWSPMLHIQDAKTPTLVIHSQKDYRLDVSEGFQLFTALQRMGVPSRMLYFPDEGHWVLKPRNSELWYRTVNDWCDRWTRSGRYAGAN